MLDFRNGKPFRKKDRRLEAKFEQNLYLKRIEDEFCPNSPQFG